MFIVLQQKPFYSGLLKQTVSDVFRELLRHPIALLVQHWNWKAALLSSSIRAGIFLFSNLSAGWRAAVSAMVLELLFRPVVSGFLGAITQAFRFAEPAWAAGLTVMLLLPAISHTIEFLVHWLHGTPNLALSISWSICFSWYSTLMNFYAMKRGVMVVNAPDASSLGNDIRRMPRVFAGFVAAGPLFLYRLFKPASTPNES